MILPYAAMLYYYDIMLIAMVTILRLMMTWYQMGDAMVMVGGWKCWRGDAAAADNDAAAAADDDGGDNDDEGDGDDGNDNDAAADNDDWWWYRDHDHHRVHHDDQCDHNDHGHGHGYIHIHDRLLWNIIIHPSQNFIGKGMDK